MVSNQPALFLHFGLLVIYLVSCIGKTIAIKNKLETTSEEAEAEYKALQMYVVNVWLTFLMQAALAYILFKMANQE
jgi:hypothetical protein